MDLRKHQVRDAERKLQFTGVVLAESTSRRSGQARWVEFQLYRTKAGSYVLSRVGHSLVFHLGDCPLVSQYRLRRGEVAQSGIPCEQCEPLLNDPEVYPERTRYWAQVMEKPTAVLEALTKYDHSGARYLTLVAQRLLAEASELDERIRGAYMVEHVA